MKVAEIDVLLVFGGGGTSTGNVRYLSNWYSNSIYNQSLLLLPIDEDPVLFIRLQPYRAKQLSWITDIRQSGRTGYAELTEDCMVALNQMYFGKSRIGLVGNINETWRGMAEDKFKRDLPEASFVDGDKILSTLRSIKSSEEIEAIRRACVLVDLSLNAFRNNLSEGKTDFQVLGAGEFAARSEGAEEMLNFLGTSKWGKFVPPISLAQPWGRRFEKNDVVIVEFNECIGGYRSESLRMASLSRPTKQEKSIFNAAYACYEAVMKTAKPGRTIGEAISQGVKVLNELGYAANEYVSKTHSSEILLGHGIGLDMFESPLLSVSNTTMFKPGMTFVLHPGIFGAYTGKKWGALIGETVQITESGAKPIFESKWALEDFADTY